MRSSLADNFRHLLVKVDIEGAARADANAAPANGQAARNPLGANAAPLLDNAIMKAMQEYFGIEGLSQIQPRIMRDAGAPAGHIVVRCMRGQERRLAQGLVLFSKLEGKNARFEVRRISGTINGLIS